MPRAGTMLHLVSYDMPSSPAGDRRRAKLARFLEGHGIRVQMSVFELDLDPQKLPSICDGIMEGINEKEDHVRIYALCGTCASRNIRLGVQATVEYASLVVW